MPFLSQLPGELLDTIIEIVILAERAPFTDTNSAGKDRDDPETELQRAGLLDCWETKSVRPEHSQPQANATGLLRASRLLHGRTQDAIARLYPDGPRYKLDAMLVNEREMWTTWLHVPVVAQRIQRVDMQIRIFGPCLENRRTSVFFEDESSRMDGPTEIHWTLYYILERFLKFGFAQIPQSPPDMCDGKEKQNSMVHLKDLGIVVGHIAINVSIGDLKQETFEDTLENIDRWDERIEQTETRLPLQAHPSWVAGNVYDAIDTVLSISKIRLSYERFAQFVYDRVGSFEVSWNGSETQTHNLADRLSRKSARAERY